MEIDTQYPTSQHQKPVRTGAAFAADRMHASNILAAPYPPVK